MNRRFLLILVLLGAGLAVMLWAAAQPSMYLVHIRGLEPPHPYQWFYPLFFLGLGSASLVLLKPWGSGYTVLGSVSTLSLWIGTCIYFLGNSMHQPPAHFQLVMVSFIGALLLIFYTGYVLVLRSRSGA
jgi:hypothetical protein